MSARAPTAPKFVPIRPQVDHIWPKGANPSLVRAGHYGRCAKASSLAVIILVGFTFTTHVPDIAPIILVFMLLCISCDCTLVPYI